MRFCLITGCFLLAALAAPAAESTAPEPARITSVVRADPRTGRLVRTIAVPPRSVRARSGVAAWAGVADSIDKYARETAERYQVDPLLVRSVIQVESNYNLLAVSPKGAQGLMQLMPGTARRFAVKNSFNPWENIDGGVRYLKYLLTLFDGREAPETLALAAYNAGEGAVLKHGGVPPYQETTQYVRRVAKKWNDARAAAGIAAGSAAMAQTAAAYPLIEQFIDSRGILHLQTRSAP
jgi:soluble lytic murein transglycosylase-like protein